MSIVSLVLQERGLLMHTRRRNRKDMTKMRASWMTNPISAFQCSTGVPMGENALDQTRLNVTIYHNSVDSFVVNGLTSSNVLY